MVRHNNQWDENGQLFTVKSFDASQDFMVISLQFSTVEQGPPWFTIHKYQEKQQDYFLKQLFRNFFYTNTKNVQCVLVRVKLMNNPG